MIKLVLNNPIIATVMIVFLASGARAEPVNIARMTMGYTYYNRVGATIADHDATVAACVKEASKVRSFDSQMPSILDGVVGSMIQKGMNDAMNRGAFAAAIENCMVVQGWRVVRVPDKEGEELSKLEASELSGRMTEWIGARSPHGDVVRVWANDAANGNTVRFEMRPGHQNNGLLSLKATTASPLAKVMLPEIPKPPKITLDPKWPTRPLKPEQISGVAPEAGIIIINLRGVSYKTGFGLWLTRQGATPESAPAETDHAPDYIDSTIGLLFAKKEANFLAFAAPPGRWRVARLASSLTLNFCLGAPSFEVKAGEVIYAGMFDLSAENLGPDMSLDSPKAWLTGQPAADKLKPATYTNGSRGLCGGNGIYALEFKDAPFESDYTWGSKAIIK